MAKIVHEQPSRTLAEYRLLPGLTTHETTLDRVSLQTDLVAGPPTTRAVTLNVPIVAAAMQAVSGPEMGIELARQGGAAFIYCSQPVDAQAAMVATIKNHKAGFVEPRTVPLTATVAEVDQISRDTGFSTFPVVDADGRLLGLITRNDYDTARHGDRPVTARMIPRDRLDVGVELTSLKEANHLLLDGHHSVLPVIDRQDRLQSLVFKKDIRDHMSNPLEAVDGQKRLLAVAAANTHDYRQRVTALVEAEVDAISLDSSDGHSVFQEEAIRWIAERHPELPVIGGNVITGAGFDHLVRAGAHGVKVGMGGGSICITQEQKGTGRGLATAILDVCRARDAHRARTGGVHIPVIADGGIVTSKDIVIALALGADAAMLGRFFARMKEAPGEKVVVNNRVMKRYWGEGSSRARDWTRARYQHSRFVEGVEGFVEYAGALADNLPEVLAKIRASMSSCGVATIRGLHAEAELELVSALSIREGQVHDITMSANEPHVSLSND